MNENIMANNDNDIQIAGRLSIGIWQELKGRLDSTNDRNRDKAFILFEKRIKNRYLKLQGYDFLDRSRPELIVKN